MIFPDWLMTGSGGGGDVVTTAYALAIEALIQDMVVEVEVGGDVLEISVNDEALAVEFDNSPIEMVIQ
jgi:hypothetical protein